MDHLEVGRYTRRYPSSLRRSGREGIGGEHGLRIPWRARMPATSLIGSLITERESSLDMSAQGAADLRVGPVCWYSCGVLRRAE